MATKFILLTAVALAGQVLSQQLTISSDAVTGEITVDANDLKLVKPQGLPVSLADIVSRLQGVQDGIASLTNTINTVNATVAANSDDIIDIPAAIDAAVAGGLDEARVEDKKIMDALEPRIAAIEAQLAGYTQLQETVGDLVEDVKYLLAHSENVTACATIDQLHLGDGSCASPVPSCARPTSPDGGTIAFSSEFIIPGVTATVKCPRDGDFVKGPTVRICNQTTKAFYPALDPTCVACKVAGCYTCGPDENSCTECSFGFDLSADNSTCTERKDTVITLGGSPPGSRHNWREAQMLEANAQNWKRFYPTPPFSGTGAAAALIKGSIYFVNSGGATMLKAGESSWSSMARPQKTYSWYSFSATINGVSTKQDGLYVFGTSYSGVYKPGTNTWTILPPVSQVGGGTTMRHSGATAVVGGKIYCLGGYYTTSRKPGKEVDVFDTSTLKWSAGVDMTSNRMQHAAAAYNGKIYVFGGNDGSFRLKTVEAFDVSTGKWATLKDMPEAWAEISTNPLPVFSDGSILVPYAYRLGGAVKNSLTYDTRKNTWTNGPVPPLRGGRYTIVMGALK